MMERTMKKRSSLAVLMLSVLLLLSACGNGNSNSGSTSAAAPTPEVSESVEETTMDWAARKALNESAGEITYVTGYYFAASPPDIQMFVADELGYFEELGLNVNILPGLDYEGMKFLAAGQAQIASAGTPSLVIQSVASGAEITGIATYGSVGTSALMVMADSGITGPKDLVGKTIGFHGALPPNMLTMFKNEGIDPMSVKGVSVGYDPTVLSTGSVDALTVYKSNEPYQLEKMGEKVIVIDPGQYGAETSFGTVVVSNKFAEKYPTAVEDFLRALAKAHEYAVLNPDEALDILAARSNSVYDLEAEKNRWYVERDIVEGNRENGIGIGSQTVEQWQREADMLLEAQVIPQKVDVSSVMTNQYNETIFDGATVIWPEN